MTLWDWIVSSAHVMLMAMIPVVEVKGAIPIGVALGMPLWSAFAAATIGAFVPAPLIMLFFRPVAAFCKKHIGFMRKFLEWVERRAHNKGQMVRKYSLLGLLIFVAIPLPGTGVWTGSLIAALLDLRLKHALPVILLGDIVASFLITLLSFVLV